MKVLLLFLLTISNVYAANDLKFHFGDCVEIISGFYKNCTGRIMDYEGLDQNKMNEYDVYITCKDLYANYVFLENELKSYKSCQ